MNEKLEEACDLLIYGMDCAAETKLKTIGEASEDGIKDLSIYFFTEFLWDSEKVLLSTIRDLTDTVGSAFTGLSIPDINAGQLALAGGGAAGGVTNNRSMTINGLSVNINGYEAKNDDDLADTIVHRINNMLNEDDSVWGK